MKLKTFNAETVVKSPRKKPFVYMNRKTGVISINRAAAVLTKIEAGDQIQFLQDEDDPESWYIEKVTNNGFQTRHNSNKNAIVTNSSGVINSIFASMGYDATSGRVFIGEYIKAGERIIHTLITASLKS